MRATPSVKRCGGSSCSVDRRLPGRQRRQRRAASQMSASMRSSQCAWSASATATHSPLARSRSTAAGQRRPAPPAAPPAQAAGAGPARPAQPVRSPATAPSRRGTASVASSLRLRRRSARQRASSTSRNAPACGLPVVVADHAVALQRRGVRPRAPAAGPSALRGADRGRFEQHRIARRRRADAGRAGRCRMTVRGSGSCHCHPDHGRRPNRMRHPGERRDPAPALHRWQPDTRKAAHARRCRKDSIIKCAGTPACRWCRRSRSQLDIATSTFASRAVLRHVVQVAALARRRPG